MDVTLTKPVASIKMFAYQLELFAVFDILPPLEML